MGITKAFHPLPFKRRGFHGLKPKFCKWGEYDVDVDKLLSKGEDSNNDNNQHKQSPASDEKR
jgi:hypothetical protein